MHFLHTFRPGGANEGKDIPDVLVTQHFGKTRHCAFEPDTTGVKKSLTAKARIIEKHRIVVVPCMSGLIMWRRRQCAVVLGCTPIWFTFKIVAMTGCTIVSIKHTPSRNVAPIKFMCGKKRCAGQGERCDEKEVGSRFHVGEIAEYERGVKAIDASVMAREQGQDAKLSASAPFY